MSIDNKKLIFIEKLNILFDKCNKRSFFLDNKLYNRLLMEMKEAKTLVKDKQPLTTKHYR